MSSETLSLNEKLKNSKTRGRKTSVFLRKMYSMLEVNLSHVVDLSLVLLSDCSILKHHRLERRWRVFRYKESSRLCRNTSSADV